MVPLDMVIRSGNASLKQKITQPVFLFQFLIGVNLVVKSSYDLFAYDGNKLALVTLRELTFVRFVIMKFSIEHDSTLNCHIDI